MGILCGPSANEISRVKDYSSAASYFHQLTSFYYNNDWTRLEKPMLDMYAQCLKQLDRKLDFCRTGLQLLAKTTDHREPRHRAAEISPYKSVADLGHYLHDVLDASRHLQRSVSAPLYRHFGQVFLDPYIRHFDRRDGFRMSLRLQNLMPVAFETQEIRVKIASIGEDQRFEIWLTTGVSTHLGPGTNLVTVSTAVCYRRDIPYFGLVTNVHQDHVSRLVQFRKDRRPISEYNLRL